MRESWLGASVSLRRRGKTTGKRWRMSGEAKKTRLPATPKVMRGRTIKATPSGGQEGPNNELRREAAPKRAWKRKEKSRVVCTQKFAGPFRIRNNRKASGPDNAGD